jgi:hypothetical protein
MSSPTLAANRPAVLDEVFDGEAVLVNLGTGRYFALDLYATQIWNVLSGGATLDELYAQMALIRGEPVEEIHDPVLRCLHRFGGEALMTAEGEFPDAPAPPDPDSLVVEPVVQGFAELEDLLLLDPIHDIDLAVDGSGWPTAPQEVA